MCAFLIIIVPWPMLDISRDKMRAELEKTYPNVISLMEERSNFLMYTYDMHPVWLHSCQLFSLQAFVPFLFRGIPDMSMLVSAFCLIDFSSRAWGRIPVSFASVHAIINSSLIIILHKPYRDKV
ncbi:hypothetical protein PMAYCL1PPCAC_26232, partial [Pristionchus mayeri]